MKKNLIHHRHPRESGDPASPQETKLGYLPKGWIPAFAGMMVVRVLWFRFLLNRLFTRAKTPAFAASLLLCLFASPLYAVEDAPGVALYGVPKYPAHFQHLDYVNPDAAKGGTIRFAAMGGFDTLNPSILKGDKAEGLGLVYQTLMEATLDEPNSIYGLVAQSMAFPEDRSWVSFKLRPEARFSDGTPVTVEDVIWSFETLQKQGHPFYRSYYRDVVKAEKMGPHEVKFTFSSKGNTELPMILGQLPVLPQHDWVKRKFAETTLEPVIGSGPYKIESVDPGHSITFVKVKDWWGAALPLNKGRYNFDRVRWDYYRDAEVAQEAFMAHRYDFKMENIAKTWATGYEGAALQRGDIKKESLKNQLPSGMQAFAYNIRRPLFQNPLVREALAYAFDYEWANKNLAYGAYARTISYFDNSELAATGLPSPEELALLTPWRNDLPPRVFTQTYAPPKTDGSGNNRANMKQARALLQQAGWTIQGGGQGDVLKNSKGEAFTFEILLDNPVFERWIQPFLRNLEKLGIKANVRVVDSAQYQNRLNDFDFDMIVAVFNQSLTPGNEQRDFWGSAKADVPGSHNLMGIKNQVVDFLTDKITTAKTRPELLTAVHALDRVLLWNFYVIPQWHTDSYRIAYWKNLTRPPINPPYGLPVVDSWQMTGDRRQQ